MTGRVDGGVSIDDPTPETINGALVTTALFAVGRLAELAILGGVSVLVVRVVRRQREANRRTRRGFRGPPTSAPRPAASR